MSTRLNLDIWSDVVCPFCYIGKRQLEQALTTLSEAQRARIEVVWHSFQLDPGTEPSPGTTVIEWLARRKGITVGQSRQMHEQVGAMARAHGLNYQFDTMIVANTAKAHRLIQAARTEGTADRLEEGLFAAYFLHGKDLNDEATLVSLAQEAGLTAAQAQAALKDSDGTWARRVEEDVQRGVQLGCRGVPYARIAGRVVSGAQGAEAFRQALVGAVTEWSASGA